MNQKSSLREDPQFVSGVLTGNKREQSVAINRRCVGDPGAEENRIQQQGVFGWLSEGLGFFD
jgi:hypothetical protein